MENFRVPKGRLQNRVWVPPSKSYANRALILGALIPRPFSIRRLPTASDVTNLLAALNLLGLEIHSSQNEVIIKNSFPECESESAPSEIFVGEGGTTARFLAMMLLLGKRKYSLRLGQRLKCRPWDEFIRIANDLGAYATIEDDLLVLQGPLKPINSLKVDCSATTQYATALQLLSFKTNISVFPINMQSSQSYWEMSVYLSRQLPLVDSFSSPGDWSSASYPMAFAALNHEIFFPDFFHDEFQADSKFLEILKSLGALRETSQGIFVFPHTKTFSLDLDVSDCLDLVPTLVFLLSHIEGEHKLRGVRNLVNKESDRLNESVKLLKIFGKRSSSHGNDLVIFGDETISDHEINLELPDDHRMVMAGTLFLLHHQGGTVHPAVSVKKSYPDFFELISY